MKVSARRAAAKAARVFTPQKELVNAVAKNLHNPVRGKSETQAEYRDRMKASAITVSNMTLSTRRKAGVSSREEHRKSMHESGSMSKKAGHYSKFLRDWITGKNLMAIKEAKLRRAGAL